MKYSDFKKILKENNLKGAYLFTGEESLIIESTIEYIIDHYIDEMYRDFNLYLMHGKELELDNFYTAADSYPFMTEKKVIVIDELTYINEKTKSDDEFFKTLDNISDDTIIIFQDFENELKKTTKLYKYFKNNKNIVEFSKLNKFDFNKFIESTIKKSGKTILNNDISYFAMLSGYNNKRLDVNLLEVKSELDKLINYVDGEQINRSHIDHLLTKKTDSNIFNLLDSLVNKNPRESLNITYDLYLKDESVAGIVHMIGRRYRHIYEFISMKNEQKAESEIKKVISISDYEFKNVASSAYKTDLCSVKDNLNEIYNIEKLIKTSSQDEYLLLQYLVIKIAS